ncbi:hypothetical protein T4E_8712 [Trichinella pseudospiralis]|uniref:Uncharacterized protein n=1 Tax=Trichinella pseudospiralis TaxID=6337 RepID=A0A0V0Y1L5_TRIPS|nr:hypothetical protein T4E_8712 [Trichinella pseudospiralis]
MVRESQIYLPSIVPTFRIIIGSNIYTLYIQKEQQFITRPLLSKVFEQGSSQTQLIDFFMPRLAEAEVVAL